MGPASASPRAIAYRPDLDGLRAVMLGTIMLHHAHLPPPGGFATLDVFFVISGYLIGAQLLAELQTGRLDLVAFWERRARRILPAMALALFGTAVVGALFLLPPDYQDFGASLAAQTVFVSNHFFAADSGYFAAEFTTKPLLHTWSLSVEEQFYAVIPLLLLLLSRLPRKLGASAFILLCAVSLLCSEHLVRTDPGAGYYFAISRAWELGLGVILAGLPPLAIGRAARELLAATGVAAIGWAAATYDTAMAFPGLAALLPCGGGACLILAGAAGSTLVGRLLSVGLLVFLGKISYSLYLWHWPALVFADYFRLGPPSRAVDGLAYLGALAVSILSWKYVETPFRTRRWLPRRRTYFLSACAIMGALGVAGLAIHRLHGVEGRMPARAAAYTEARSDRIGAFEHNLTLAEARAGRFIPLGSPNPAAPLKFLVWGDSHAMSLLAAFDDLGRLHSVRGCAATREGTRPLVHYVPAALRSHREELLLLADAVVAFVREKRIPDVVLVGRWGHRHGRVETATPEYLRAVAETFSALHAAGARVWVVEDVPQLPWDAPRALAKVALAGGDPATVTAAAGPYLAQIGGQTRQFAPFLAPGDRLLDPSPYFVRDSGVVVSHDGAALFYDDHHLTVHGARLLEPMLEPLFAR